MMSMGDCYKIPALKAVAAAKFERSTIASWDSADFAVAVKICYNTNRGGPIKKIIDRRTVDHSLEIFGTGLETSKGQFREMLDVVRGYAADVLTAMNTAKEWKTYKAARQCQCILNTLYWSFCRRQAGSGMRFWAPTTPRARGAV